MARSPVFILLTLTGQAVSVKWTDGLLGLECPNAYEIESLAKEKVAAHCLAIVHIVQVVSLYSLRAASFSQPALWDSNDAQDLASEPAAAKQSHQSGDRYFQHC